MFPLQKVNEIGLALIRVAVQIRRLDFRGRIEALALDLLETTAAKDWEALLTTIEVVRAMVGFGKKIYQIEPVNAKILDQELEGLSVLVKKTFGFSGHNEIIDIFHRSNEKSTVISGNGDSAEIMASNTANTSGNGNNEEYGNGNGNGIAATIRQSAIIDRIKNIGKASLKDIIAELPDVSERTIRYDLQRLCSQGVLERIGNGGPSTYYIARL